MEKHRDLFEILHADHERVGQILSQLRERSDVSDHQNRVTKVSQEIEAHSSAEEAVVYSALEDLDATENLASDSRNEHNEIRLCLSAVSSLETDKDQWERAVIDLETAVRNHVKVEEGELFALMREGLTAEQLGKMASRFTEKKKELMQSLGG